MEYDKACQLVEDLRKELHETENKIIELKEQERYTKPR